MHGIILGSGVKFWTEERIAELLVKEISSVDEMETFVDWRGMDRSFCRAMVKAGYEPLWPVDELVVESEPAPPVDIEPVKPAVRRKFAGHLTVRDIQEAVAAHYNITIFALSSNKRDAKTIRHRHVAIYLTKKLMNLSLPAIGRRFGGRDHTTILNAIRNIENLVNNNNGVIDDIEAIKRAINAERA